MEESILFGPEIDDRALDREIDDVNDALAETGRISPDIDTSGLGDIEMGATMGAGTRGGMGRDVASLVPMADYRNRLLEDILDTLQAGGAGGDGDDGLGRLLGGGGLGGLLGLGGGLLGGIGAGVGASLLGRLSPGEMFRNIRERIGQAIQRIRGRIPSPQDLIPDITIPNLSNLIPDLNLEAGGLAAGVGGVLGGLVSGGQRLLGGLGGVGRGVATGLSGLAGIPSRVLQDLERRGVTDLLGGGVGGTQAALAGPLGRGGLLQGLLGLGGGGRVTPGQRAAARSRDQRFRQSPGAAPGQVARNLNTNVDITIDPSGLNDLKRDIQRELEQSLVPQVVSQVERELSTGLGGG